MAVAFAAVTAIRSNQWADIVTFAMYESEHRPNSPRAAGFLGQALAKHGQFDEAMASFRRAAALDTSESAFLIAMHLIPPAANRMVSPEEKSETIRRLASGPLSASTVLALQTTNSCLMNRCSFAQTSAESWARTLLSAKGARYDKSFLYYLLGRSLAGQGKTRGAIEAYTSSYQLDPNYLHPQIEIVRLLLTESRLAEAEQTLNVLRAVNATHRYPRHEEIHELSFILEELKKHTNRKKGAKNTGFIRQDG
jgi:tetratricopeptide (TPR) repeat protein